MFKAVVKVDGFAGVSDIAIKYLFIKDAAISFKGPKVIYITPAGEWDKDFGGATVSNTYFNFPAEVNDTLLFTAIGYDMQTLVVKDTFQVEYPYLEIFMQQDTIQLAELIIRPWHGNYQRFKQAILDYEPPETDLDRAYKNLAIMDLHSLLYNSPATPSIAFRNTMKMYNDNLYWAGQLPPVSITNPLAWAQFFKALKDGDLKRK